MLERERAGERIPAVITIGRILRRHGLSVPQKRRRRSWAGAGPLAEAGRPNAVWCADFKGWFWSRDGTRIDPLTITDAYSRYVLRCVALGAPDTAHSRPVFEAAFREFGLPERIRSDNGPPFGAHGESGLTGLMVWFIRLGIGPEHIEAGRPQQDRRHERMHRTLKQETASSPAASRRAQQERFERFRREYNEQRPHQALQQQVPAAYYQASARPYPERLPEVGYPPDWEVRRVSAGGQMRWRRQSVFVGHALDGERVGLEPLREGWWQVWFSFYQLGFVDESRGKLEHPPARRARPRVGR